MGTRNHATHDQSSARKRAGKQTKSPNEAPKDQPSERKQERSGSAKADKERSDWEGMTPRPEQGSDDVAAPGEVPGNSQ